MLIQPQTWATVCRRAAPSGQSRYPSLLRSPRLSTRATGAGAKQWTIQEAGSRQESVFLRDDLQLVLVHPQIPQNTGSLARTCAATRTGLHLVGPLGFKIDSTKLKRAGLDYWPYVNVQVHESWQTFFQFYSSRPCPKKLIGFSKLATRHYASPGMYGKGDWLVFGAETTGLPLEAHADIGQNGYMVKIPMVETHVRSLNLAVSGGIGLYEAIRQIDGTATGESVRL